MTLQILTGRQKAAILLMGLDKSTAAELLKGLDPEVLQSLAVEMSYMEAAGLKDHSKIEQIAQEFYNAVYERARQAGSQVRIFLDETLKDLIGPERARQIRASLTELLLQRDPFLPIRKAPVDRLASSLENEHPQAVAVVLSELSPRQSAAVLGRLSSGLRVSAVARMASVESISPEARKKVGQMIASRIEQLSGKAPEAASTGQGQAQSAIRKVAVVVRTVEKEIRDQIIVAIRKKDEAAAEAIEQMMVLWEDIPLIADRALQGALRGIEERTLALALFDCPGQIISKIKSNISERAAALVEEETSLMSRPKAKDVGEAREKVLHKLRELLKNGDLAFEEEKV